MTIFPTVLLQQTPPLSSSFIVRLKCHRQLATLICALFRWKDVETLSAEQVPHFRQSVAQNSLTDLLLKQAAALVLKAAKPLSQNPRD